MMKQIRAQQFDDVGLRLIWDKVLSGEDKEALLNSDVILGIGGWVYVLREGDWIRLILEEAQCCRYSIHSRMTKMYLIEGSITRAVV